MKYCPGHNKINTLWLLITTVMYSCLNFWGVLKMLANISQPSLTASHTFKIHLETVEAAFSTSSWNQEYPTWIKSCYSQYLHLLLILAGIVAASNLWKFGFQTQDKSCNWSTASLAPSKIFSCLYQSSVDNVQPRLRGQDFCLWSLLQLNLQLNITSTQKNPWHFIPHSYNAIPLLMLSFPKSSLPREQLRAASSGKRNNMEHKITRKHLSLAAAATGAQLHLGTSEVYCALCTKLHFDQLPLGTWRKPSLNTVFEPLAVGSILVFLSESFPVGYKCLGNHSYTHPQRPHLLVLSHELIPQLYQLDRDVKAEDVKESLEFSSLKAKSCKTKGHPNYLDTAFKSTFKTDWSYSLHHL